MEDERQPQETGRQESEALEVDSASNQENVTKIEIQSSNKALQSSEKTSTDRRASLSASSREFRSPSEYLSSASSVVSNPSSSPASNTATTEEVTSTSSVTTRTLDPDDKQTQIAKFNQQQQEGSHFSITWQNFDFVVESKWYKLASQRKPILNGLSGVIRSGELTAILGPSGAGKSTLIDCLLGKHDSGLRGKTRIVFEDKQYEQFRRRKRPLRIATIPQQDHLLDTLTVLETFMFASKIKNAHLTYEDEEEDIGEVGSKSNKPRKPFNHLANVQRVIAQLNLSSCASLKCGKLSGGQYKRVSIGQELLSRPDIMVLDEPTSGLDSVTCYQTVKALRELIDSSPYPMAIVTTIHQPDIDVFSLFHKAYVLASGGRAIYEGPTSGILATVQLGVEMVEARRKQSGWGRKVSSGGTDLANLKQQLEDKHVNPARLIVEVAADEYGYEITGALNEIQHRDHLPDHQYTSSPSSSMASLSTQISPSGSMNPLTSKESTHMHALVDTRPSPDLNKMPGPPPPPTNYWVDDPMSRSADLDRLLHLDYANTDQRRSFRVFVRHVIYHMQRSWITILRDPMLFAVMVALHVFVPLLISYAFGYRAGEACPVLGQLDVIQEAYRTDGSLLSDLNRELRLVFENLGYMFFQIYVIMFGAVVATSLTYPIAMHVLLKEYRNGWYSLSSYFMGRTLADLPVPTVNVFVAMAISYHLTGQPSSPHAWRFLSVALVTILAALVAQTQGLLFGALLMNAPSTAVFVAPSSTAPLVVVSGFLLRLKSLPLPLQILSKLSYFTYVLNGFVISRYGFNRCPCDEADFIVDETRRVPQQARAIIDLWAETFRGEFPQAANETTDVNLVGKLVDTITRAKTFGYEMTSCDQVKPFMMLDYDLQDSDLQVCFIVLIVMLVAFRWLTFFTLTWKIKSSI